MVSSSGELTYADFYQYCCQVAHELDGLAPGRLACHLPNSPELVALMFAAGLRGRSLVLFNRDYSRQQIEPLLQSVNVAVLITDDPELSPPGCQVLGPEILDQVDREYSEDIATQHDSDSEILILTSGTTGLSKCARYSWSGLFAQVSTKTAPADERWLLAYHLNHFAGMMMLFHVISTCGTLVFAKSNKVADSISAISEHRVNHVSSTPTFWRYALTLLQSNRDQISLQHLTLGTEAVSADLLDRLHALFPEARIVQVYGSTEAGSVISVSDLKPGLPISVLSRPESAKVQFRIVDDELQVKSSIGMKGYLDANSENGDAATSQWRDTGDLVKIEGDRIMFMGRKNETINCGGIKVHPLDVENMITPLAGVKVVKAYGKDNAIVGQIVAVDVVCHESYDPEKVEEDIRQACNALPPHSRPRSINMVESMATNNGKLTRH